MTNMSEAVFKYELGDRVSDRITGQIGVITSRAEHLFGCARYWIEPQELKDGKPIDGRWIDEDALDIKQAGVIARRAYRVHVVDKRSEPVRAAGGPSDQPASTTRASER
jgi:hypothetical protein